MSNDTDSVRMKLNSTAESMSVELSKLLRSVEYAAKFSKSHKEKRVERFKAMVNLFASDDPSAGAFPFFPVLASSIPRLGTHQLPRTARCI